MALSLSLPRSKWEYFAYLTILWLLLHKRGLFWNSPTKGRGSCQPAFEQRDKIQIWGKGMSNVAVFDLRIKIVRQVINFWMANAKLIRIWSVANRTRKFEKALPLAKFRYTIGILGFPFFCDCSYFYEWGQIFWLFDWYKQDKRLQNRRIHAS